MSDKPKFVDTLSRASLPGRVKVSLLVWGRCFPKETLPRLVRLALAMAVPLVFVIAAPSSAWGIVAFSLVLIAAQAFALWREATCVQEHFKYGCLNPAKVVSVSPYLIAVYGDLGLQEGDSWPTIKILSQPLEKVRGRRMQNGDRLATVSLYSGYHNRPHWEDFDPIAVNCVTDDESQIRDALLRLNQVNTEGWDDLERFLALLPKPYKPGLYWMRPR